MSTKNKSNYENTYWSSDDFDTYWFPYQDIYRIEDKDSISNFYQPTLLHIVDTDEENKKLIKVAYIGHNTATEENTLKYIYNILATKSDSGVVLSNSTQYFTKDWKKIEKGSLSYVISPNKEFNEQEAEKQIKDIEKISAFFNTEPLPITYYSCTNLKELFQIKGFDYNPIMYREGGGGLSARQNIVFSANSSEFYTHEIMHLYIIAFYYSRAQLFNEGMATYFGGSRKYSYTWHKKNLKTYLAENPEIDLSLHLEPFERFFAGETSIPYMIGALICERTFRLYGKEKLLALLEKGEMWDLLNDVGLTKENLNTELRKELLLPPTLAIANSD
ncbi:hypothetical protein [Marivirga arenosa]|uniref:Uncharacterized protein n=1 Tax=Marivirga arenosa TaxID=3059076 RepID=A0AA52F0E4_9BACT|nr:hypothetical protein [Marivirga sp. BKB1-2]WNB18024.1 hypothetical protein QYS47_28915 [Marivirga sp. BKB1-2]